MNSDNYWININHWLQVPENSYLGSGYGFKDKLSNFLNEPPNENVVNQIVSKMKTDIPNLENREVSINWAVGTNRIIITVDEDTNLFDLKL